MKIKLLVCLASIIPMVIAGCSKSPVSKVTVEGNVTVGSQNFQEGLITFAPMDGTPGAKVSVPIEASRYAIGPDQLLSAGEYSVEIYGMPPSIKAMATGQPIDHKETGYREIAAEFNSRTTLRANLIDGPNEYNFDVKYR